MKDELQVALLVIGAFVLGTKLGAQSRAKPVAPKLATTPVVASSASAATFEAPKASVFAVASDAAPETSCGGCDERRG